jgi:Tfp pilus assembly protein PilX
LLAGKRNAPPPFSARGLELTLVSLVVVVVAVVVVAAVVVVVDVF